MIFNLDPSFTPFGPGIDFKAFTFPSGCEQHVKLPESVYADKALITTRIQSAEDILTLLLITDALRRARCQRIELFMPYVPYARQDRKMEKGEPLSLKVFADLINAQGYSQVTVYDVHSDISAVLINNCEVVSNHALVHKVLDGRTDYWLISPDAGAYKKIFKVAQHIGYTGEIVTGNKFRDTKTGSIKSLSISHTDLEGKDCYIVDDICDGGGTFILLAEELKRCGAGRINLIVSHGIFSKGLAVLHNINKIYTTDSFKALPTEDSVGAIFQQKLKTYKLFDGLLS